MALQRIRYHNLDTKPNKVIYGGYQEGEYDFTVSYKYSNLSQEVLDLISAGKLGYGISICEPSGSFKPAHRWYNKYTRNTYHRNWKIATWTYASSVNELHNWISSTVYLPRRAINFYEWSQDRDWEYNYGNELYIDIKFVLLKSRGDSMRIIDESPTFHLTRQY